jgi:eukaryotic-like serine/threonine-protein kinase
LTGDKPFIADEPLDVLRMHREATPPRASEHAPPAVRDRVRPFDDVILRALQKRPEDRFATAAELSAAVDGALHARERLPDTSSPAISPPSSAPPPVDRAPDRSSAARPPEELRARAPFDPARRRALLGAGIAVGALALIGVVAAIASGGGRHAVATDAAPIVVAAPPDGPDPSDDVLARAHALVADGDSDGAIHLLDSARHTFPDRAVISFELGKLYFARLWWRDGLDAFRTAIHADPGFRTDPDLIKTVLRGFITTPDTDEGLARFLRSDIGDAAIPYLQETAQSHPSEKVRARAAALLERYR